MQITETREAIDELIKKCKLRISKKEQSNALDLYLSIRDYRELITVDCLLERYPEFEAYRVEAHFVFDYCRNLTQEALADLAIEMIHELTEGVIQ